MSKRFDYVKYDSTAQRQQDGFKARFSALEHMIEANPPGREKSLALTHLEDCYSRIGKMIRDEQIARNGSVPLQEERKDG